MILYFSRSIEGLTFHQQLRNILLIFEKTISFIVSVETPSKSRIIIFLNIKWLQGKRQGIIHLFRIFIKKFTTTEYSKISNKNSLNRVLVWITTLSLTPNRQSLLFQQVKTRFFPNCSSDPFKFIRPAIDGTQMSFNFVKSFILSRLHPTLPRFGKTRRRCWPNGEVSQIIKRIKLPYNKKITRIPSPWQGRYVQMSVS